MEISSLIFHHEGIFCVLIKELPHRDDSNEYTQHTVISIKKENLLKVPK